MNDTTVVLAISGTWVLRRVGGGWEISGLALFLLVILVLSAIEAVGRSRK